VSIFYSTFGTDATANLGTFFTAIRDNFPTSVTWTIPSAGDVISDATGQLTGAWTAGTGASIAGTGATAYVGGTGLMVRWITGTVVSGHKLNGRTFLCPVLTTLFDTQGTINNSSLPGILTAAQTLAGAGKLVIWHRPTSKAAANGSSALIVGAAVPDKVTSLRSRRT
jgi:hypothetical protein